MYETSFITHLDYGIKVHGTARKGNSHRLCRSASACRANAGCKRKTSKVELVVFMLQAVLLKLVIITKAG